MVVIEEAHNFCPQVGQALCSGVLKTVASEGLKFGLGLCVVTQRPAKIDKNVLSQCNTQMILKVTNPNDLKAITQSIEGLVPGMEEDIQRLPIGVAIVSGGSLTSPIQVEIRVRETQHGGTSVEILDRKRLAGAAAGAPAAVSGTGPSAAPSAGAGAGPAPGEASAPKEVSPSTVFDSESPIVEETETETDYDDSEVETDDSEEKGRKKKDDDPELGDG
jgi:hypothetical protein